MTTYNTYQEAKIANPESLICKFGDKFTIDASRYGQALQPCNPADYCMSADEFRGRGHAFVDDDLVVNINGMVQSVKADFLNTVDSPLNLCIFVLRAAALENQMNIDNLATQTPEEKEVLDALISVNRMNQPIDEFLDELKSNADGGEWVNGDKCSYEADNDSHTFIAITPNEKCCIRYDTANNFFEVNLADISKPENPQQREEREREELADTACENMFGESIQNCRPDVAATVRCMIDAGYRKESN